VGFLHGGDLSVPDVRYLHGGDLSVPGVGYSHGGDLSVPDVRYLRGGNLFVPGVGYLHGSDLSVPDVRYLRGGDLSVPGVGYLHGGDLSVPGGQLDLVVMDEAGQALQALCHQSGGAAGSTATLQIPVQYINCKIPESDHFLQTLCPYSPEVSPDPPPHSRYLCKTYH
jgi:hypothetical protein